MRRWIAGALALLAIAGLIALGAWQIERRTWKLALIAQVERRLAAAPIAAPGPNGWARIGRDDAYTRVKVRGVFADGRETLVQAATELGAGYWVLTPLVTDRDFTVLVNRGFVPPGQKIRAVRSTGEVTITGLLRVSEPGGGFLRHNDPAADRWYSRDVAAISAKDRRECEELSSSQVRHPREGGDPAALPRPEKKKRDPRLRGDDGVGPVCSSVFANTAPYFIDADAASEPGSPRGGLTVIAFANNHLQYALTWFAMAAMLAGVSLWIAFGRGRP